jgi:TonB family protein
MGKSVKIVVISPGPSTKSEYPMGEVRFGEAQAPLFAFFRTVPLGQDRGTVRSMIVDQAPFFQGMTTQPVITIKFLKARIDLQIGPSASAVAALRLCESGLLTKWGMSVAAQTSVATAPQGGVSQFFKSGDYPDDALRAGRMGVTGVRYWVGVDGKLSDCRVISSSGTESIDSQTCAVLERRGHLAPALDSAKQPLRSLSSTEIVWAIPDE